MKILKYSCMIFLVILIVCRVFFSGEISNQGRTAANVDRVVFNETRASADKTSREIVAERRYLHLPVKNGGKARRMTLAVNGKVERAFDIELAEGTPDWWAFLDISKWRGKTLVVETTGLPNNSQALEAIDQGDDLKGADDLYREAGRPRIHFSSRRGWLNDPNGLIFFEGEYHLFYQHNPYGVGWGNMHWGHAVAKDMLHWKELGIALYPDKLGPMFSGSAVVDWKNSTGFGANDKPPLVLIYTAAGDPAVQCLAYSNDKGRTWTKYSGNPILKNISEGNRDPKVFWHEPTKRWVMALYVGEPSKTEVDREGRQVVVHSIRFFSSPDLKSWTEHGKTEGFFECPDFFELALDGDPLRSKWVLTGASSEYMVGAFDGEKFTPETPKLPGHRGQGFYAAQTFNDIPSKDGRRIQIGWGQMPTPGMPFNQMMCFPCELKLISTENGPRLTWRPVREIKTLRRKTDRLPSQALADGDRLRVSIGDAPLEIRVEIEPGDAYEFVLEARGIPLRFDFRGGRLSVLNHKVPAPLVSGKLKATILVDRSSLEVFIGDGLSYAPFPANPQESRRSVELFTRLGKARLVSLEVHELESIWPERVRASR